MSTKNSPTNLLFETLFSVARRAVAAAVDAVAEDAEEALDEAKSRVAKVRARAKRSARARSRIIEAKVITIDRDKRSA